jgi:two-component system NarL family sensor kinase
MEQLKVLLSLKGNLLLNVFTCILLTSCVDRFESESKDSRILFSDSAFNSLSKRVSPENEGLEELHDSLVVFSDTTCFDLDQFRLQYLLAILNTGLNQDSIAFDRVKFLLKSIYDDDYLRSLSYRLAGILNYYQGNYSMANDYLIKSLDLNVLGIDPTVEVKTLSNLSTIAHVQGFYRQAIEYQKDAIKIGEANLLPKELKDMKLELATSFMELGELDSAAFYLNQQIEGEREVGEIQFNTLLNYGVLQMKKGQNDSAIRTFEQCLDLALQNDNISDISLSLNNLAYLNNTQGNYQEAFLLLDSMNTVDQEMRDENFAATLKDLELKYEDLERDNKLNTLEFESEKDRVFKNWVGIISVIILIASVSLIVVYRKKVKADRALFIQKEKQHEKEKQVVALYSSLEMQEQERKRFSMELHDGIGVLASTAKIRMSQIGQRIEGEELKEMLEDSEFALKGIIDDVSRIAFDMMPSVLSKLGLVAAIEELCERTSKTYGVEIEYDLDRSIHGDTNFEICLYRMVQELINNTMKYAEPSRVELVLKVTNNVLILEYLDDGKGFDKNQVKQGNGMYTLSSRTAYLKGTMHLDSEIGNGTFYKFEIPYG